MRADEWRVIRRYYARLGDFAAALNPKYAGDGSRTTSGLTSFKDRYLSLGTLALLGARFLAQVPSFVRQARRMRRAQAASSAPATVLAIPSNRLAPPQSMTPKEAFARFLRPLSGSPPEDLTARVARSDLLLLLDPLPISGYWARRDEHWAENTFIVDGAFLLFLLLCAFLRQPLRTWAEYRRLAAAAPGGGLRASLCALAAQAYAETLPESVQIEALFFTSNSTLTELLRAFLIQHAGCSRIYDIMHGVGSQQAERFYAEVTRQGERFGAAAKYRFIPQVPNLPLFGIFDRLRVPDPDASINAYLNRLFCAQGPGNDPATVIGLQQALRDVRAAAGTDDPFIVTVLGTFQDEFFISPAFRGEAYFIAALRVELDASHPGAVLAYVPHPIHGAAPLSHPLYSDHRVLRLPSSIVAWLLSDVCVSLMSSAMFEATYFGVRAATGLTCEDGLYSPYLGMVDHPMSPSLDDAQAALRRCLADGGRPPRPDIAARAAARLSMMDAQ